GGGGQGPVVALSILRPGGEHVGYAEVEKLAGLEDIQLRTGCFCNPGACQAALGLSDEEIRDNFERGHVCWDSHDLVNGQPTGLVRVSLGWMSTWEDTEAFVDFVESRFVVSDPLMAEPFRVCVSIGVLGPSETPSPGNRQASCRLESLYVYPIKSCAPQRVGKERGWPLGSLGLAYDREWAVVDSLNRALRLRQVPRMCKIRPHADPATQTLTISAPDMPDLTLPLHWGQESNSSKSAAPATAADIADPAGQRWKCLESRGSSMCSNSFGEIGAGELGKGGEAVTTVRVCGHHRKGIQCVPAASLWFTKFLGVPCSLVRAAHAAPPEMQSGLCPSAASPSPRPTSSLPRRLGLEGSLATSAILKGER
ncbi:unnamed protein product, partial [Choristocarpus tenellus]